MTDASEQRVALVTGGAARVGTVIVRQLAAHGYRVAIHANQSLDSANRTRRRAQSRRPRGGRLQRRAPRRTSHSRDDRPASATISAGSISS